MEEVLVNNLRQLVLLALAMVLVLGNRPATAEPHKDRCVIMVTIDGLANFYIDDPKSDVPVMRKLAAQGARAEGGVIAAFPTVTWPTHTTLATGTTPARHGVVGNNYFDRATARTVPLILDRIFNKDQTVKVPTIYDAAHQAGLKTAAVCWPASREARSLDWTVPDMFEADAWPKYGTQSWLKELRLAGWPVDKQNAWCSMPGGGVPRDWLYTRMVRHVLQKHAPNLILVHLVEPDHVEHAHGPRSAEAYWIASYSDDRIRDLVEAIEASPMAGKTTLFVLSDHGFFPVNYEIRPNVVLRKLGLIQGSGQTEKRMAYCMAEGGACGVYIIDEARRDQIAQQLRTELARLEGVQSVFGTGEFDQIGQPSPRQNPRGADLWLSARSDYAFSEASGGHLEVLKQPKLTGTHGYLPDQPDMLALCIVSGPGLKAGTKLGKIRAIDIAPTVARILGIELPTAEGKPLEKLLVIGRH
jgi:predicted AlkP superfamily pyrophosphatase or phosphodiesterase